MAAGDDEPLTDVELGVVDEQRTFNIFLDDPPAALVLALADRSHVH